MIIVQNILDFLETVAPQSLKMEWDNVGLLCGRANKEVHRILVALDPFAHVCQEAAQLGADLLVTHHPLIFEPLSALTDQTTTGKAILTLVANDIAAINAHTNLDCASGGVNDTLAELFMLSNIQKIPADTAGLLRQGKIASQPLDSFLHHVKNTLQCQGLRYVDGGRSVSNVAVGGGSCGSELHTVLDAGCDTFVTADVKYNQFWEAQQLGLNLIDAGHFQTENPVISQLAGKLQAAFPEVAVHISQTHADPVNFF